MSITAERIAAAMARVNHYQKVFLEHSPGAADAELVSAFRAYAALLAEAAREETP